MQPNGSHGTDLGERWLATSEVVYQRGGSIPRRAGRRERSEPSNL